jgi:hypothetical protein
MEDFLSDDGLPLRPTGIASFPLAVRFRFTPGGGSYEAATADDEQRVLFSTLDSPDGDLLRDALTADDRLRQYTLWQQRANDASTTPLPYYVPSLSLLAEAAFGRYTGLDANQVKEWADSMVLAYLEQDEGQNITKAPSSEDEIWQRPSDLPAAALSSPTSLSTKLKELQERAELVQEESMSDSPTSMRRRRPCGYVFQRGDIAWNCRTCQADPTCVICDDCFRRSDHKDHEVFFHRTTPGGCCDCGDLEAWKIEGCCDLHRPDSAKAAPPSTDDPLEAVRMAQQGLKDEIAFLKLAPTALTSKTTAALATVIGAAVHCIVQAVDGAGIGSDPSQFKIRWPLEATKIANAKLHEENGPDKGQEARHSRKNPSHFSTETLPTGYRLALRLHNDDVHTFDEVIDAMHESRHRRNTAGGQSDSLVSRREQATTLTQHVDSDGQVTVLHYDKLPAALQGFRRLKSRGLHCSLVSTPQVQQELRARNLIAWLAEISAAHPVASTLLVQALVQVQGSANAKVLAGITSVWKEARSVPLWVGAGEDERTACHMRFAAFPPHSVSSFLTRPESLDLYRLARSLVPPSRLATFTGILPRPEEGLRRTRGLVPPERYHKSPHALWGSLPARYVSDTPLSEKHPFLANLVDGPSEVAGNDTLHDLTEAVYVVDTDLRKQQEADRITASLYPHRLPGLHLLSGVATVALDELDELGMPKQEADDEMDEPLQLPDTYLPSPMEYRHLLATSSFRAPLSPVLLLLLLDPYPTKQLRSALHSLFLSLLTDARFRCRFAGALAIAYRPLSTLFCAGIGTEADTPLHFAVQILTAGSLVRALGSAPAVTGLLLPDQERDQEENQTPETSATIGVFCSPIGHTIVRCIHTNLLGATKEVKMVLNNTYSGNDEEESDPAGGSNDVLLPALTYVAGEHPLMTLLPAAPDDGFLDSRSTRHKRLPHLLRDLEYVTETPGTALRLLLPQKYPVYQGPQLSFRGEDVLAFPIVFSRMLRLAQGMDPQKRKISGGHVEYEQNRWLEAFGLSLNLAGARDALSESPSPHDSPGMYRDAMGNLVAALLREIKLWLYREGMLETGLPVPSGGPHGALDLTRVETLQRSTLHVSGVSESEDGAKDDTVALSCATGVKMSENQLSLIESALKAEGAERLLRSSELGRGNSLVFSGGTVMGNWLRVPHSPLAGDSLSFHLPLHRALAKTVRSACSVVVTEEERMSNSSWWKIPILDEERAVATPDPTAVAPHPLIPLIWPTLRSGNCRVVWTAGPDCSPQEAHRRRSRSRNVSANIAVAKVVHSLADHPIRCIAAAQQIERHLWARNGSSVAGMAINYTSTGLCRSFRDLDLLMVQLSAAGMSAGLGARRVFSLLLSRFSMDGYLCDPERRPQASGTTSPFASNMAMWVNPPRLQDADHAVVLAESLFSTLCVVVTELPPPPPTSKSDTAPLQQTIRRELLHALASEPRSRSEAMNAAAIAASRRDDGAAGHGDSSGGSLFRDVFAVVLGDIAKQKTAGSSRASSGPPAFELKPDFCGEYDPTFYHLRRQDHQHAMDVIARLRKQKWANEKEAADTFCLPVVCAPPKAHPRFLPCRLLLHLPPLDAAVRRLLLFALAGGSWLPPPEPRPISVDVSESPVSKPPVGESEGVASSPPGDVNVTTFTRRLMHRASSGSSTFLKRQSSDQEGTVPFSKDVVAASAVSFLEVLQLLTLQVHTLEECASLHRSLPDLDEESRQISAGLSINSYLGRLVVVPDSLNDVWALKPSPAGPLDSRGSGENRGSILGLLIALYEHRPDDGSAEDSDEGQGENDHGGARNLAGSGLKWLLRFVNALVDGAPSVAGAVKSATSGVPVTLKSPSMTDSGAAAWTINDAVQSTVKHMLHGLRDLWPAKRAKTPSTESSSQTKSKEAGKAAQKKIMEKMKMQQNVFASRFALSEDQEDKNVEEECIICRCDDADGENNGPLGYLGHVQRSRVLEMRYMHESSRDSLGKSLGDTYRVVGHKGCQLRATEAMDSKPLDCLPKGSIVTVLERKFVPEYDILSRRVRVRHESMSDGIDVVAEGWASVQSSQGYVILKPLASLCFSNTRWGMTRPIIKQCGHAAHLKCVETHTLSLHQQAARDQPYDGRFAANINDGEFLCPLCKQLSNILIPRDTFASRESSDVMPVNGNDSVPRSSRDKLRKLLCSSRLVRRKDNVSEDMCWQAFEGFGSNVYQAMSVTWDRTSRKKQQQQWHPSIRKWDYDEDMASSDSSTKGLLQSMRQQLIAWAAIGHSAAAAEAGARGMEEVLPFGTMSQTADPWLKFNEAAKFSHPMLLELKRTVGGASGLLELLSCKFANQLAKRDGSESEEPFVGGCLADALQGNSWALRLARPDCCADDLLMWSELTALTASIPCHVARDGAIPQKCEARAVAGAMWASMGLGASASSPGEPPAPFAVRRVLQSAGINDVNLAQGWGTLDPYVSPTSDDRELPVPFRPGIASGFLYTPLLGWDLLTFAAAVCSTVLVNETAVLPTCEDLFHLTRLLVTARIVQAVVTPHGAILPDDMDICDDDEECWTPDEKTAQAKALARLYSHCRTMVKDRKLDSESGLVGTIEGLSPLSVLAGVGAAVLPFTRALVLLLRAVRACIQDRLLKSGADENQLSSYDTIDKILCGGDLMEVEDGFFFLKAIGGPSPTALIEGSGDWLPLINRWLVAVVGFDMHSGSAGRSAASSLLPHLVEKSLNLNASNVGSIKRAAASLPQRVVDEAQESEVINEVMSAEDMLEDGEEDAFEDTLGDRPAILELLQNAAAAAAGEIMDADMDEGEEIIDFGEQLMGASMPLYDMGDDHFESSDDSVYDETLEGDREFAHVSRSPILMYQPSLLGLESIGPGRHGTTLEYSAASAVMADLSHFGVVHHKQVPTFSLIRLPKSFVELYNIVNKVKGREEIAGEDSEETSSAETAICLLTGAVLRSGSARRSSYNNRALRPPGACTLHARKTGSGIGIFFLVQKCTVLLMHNNKSAYSPSLYVDEHGEEDPGLRRGRPLFLNDARYRALELLWRQQGIPWEVAQIRSTSDRVIRDNWY